MNRSTLVIENTLLILVEPSERVRRNEDAAVERGGSIFIARKSVKCSSTPERSAGSCPA